MAPTSRSPAPGRTKYRCVSLSGPKTWVTPSKVVVMGLSHGRERSAPPPATATAAATTAGRSLVGNAGLLLTRVALLKQGEEKNFAVVDAAMNDLSRPALYDAYHRIEPVVAGDGEPRRYDVVGPICESGDFLARDRDLAIAAGDLLAVLSAGAYGMAMSSNYNSRPRAAEVLVRGRDSFLARQRESVADLMRGERPLPPD